MAPQAHGTGVCFARMRPRDALLWLLLTGCGAVFPEITPPLRTPPPGFELSPPPPPDVFFIRFGGADIPKKTRDGRQWDSTGGGAPDPFAKLLVNGKELILTPVESNTLRPTWPDQDRGNYRIPAGSTLRVELWDSNPLTSHPICAETLPRLDAREREDSVLEIECDNGGRVRLVLEPAHGKLGLGLSYELRTEQAFVTRVVKESPAGRAGLAPGDRILAVEGQDVATMEEGKLQSLVNANASTGVKLSLLGADERRREVTLRDGAVYPVVGEGVAID